MYPTRLQLLFPPINLLPEQTPPLKRHLYDPLTCNRSTKALQSLTIPGQAHTLKPPLRFEELHLKLAIAGPTFPTFSCCKSHCLFLFIFFKPSPSYNPEGCFQIYAPEIHHQQVKKQQTLPSVLNQKHANAQTRQKPPREEQMDPKCWQGRPSVRGGRKPTLPQRPA